MKLKISLGEGGLKGFFTQHAEKVIFGVVIALVAFFVYTSATQDALDPSRTPDDLKRQAASAGTHIRNDYSEEIVLPRQDDVDDYPTRARSARSRINEAGYTLPNPLDRPLIPKKSKRGDPEIYAPVQVEAEGAVYTVAMRAKRTDGDPWVNDKAAVVKAEEEEEPRRRRKPRRSMMGEGDEGMLGYGSGMGMMGGGEEGGGYGYGMEGMEEEGGMMGGPTGTAMGMTGARKLDKFYIEHYIRGYRGSSGMGAGGAGTLGKSRAVVAVKALVPYEKQWEEYERALANATGYSPAQDIPNYLMFIAERAEVPADPDAPLQWTTISHSQYEMGMAMQNYGGQSKEMADAAYVLPGTITMPIPPILLKPHDFAVHSEIPRQQVQQFQAAAQQQKDEGRDEPGDPTEMDLSQGIPQMPKTRPGGAGGYGMGQGMAGFGMGPGMGGYGSGGGMMPYPGGGEGGGEYGEDGSGMEEGGYGGGMEGGYGMGMEGGHGMGAQSRQPLVKYKMVRFFDLTAEPGKSYRYRVAVVLEDPNRPRNANADPNRRILDEEVRTRIEEVEAQDAADTEYAKKNGKPKRTYYRKTEWSEPSNIVTVAIPAKFVAGAAMPGKAVKLPEGTTVLTTDASGNQVQVQLKEATEVATAEASGKLVTVVWDEKRAAEVPAERDVYHGSYLTFEQDADVLHPLSLQIKTVEKHSFDTDAFVADFRSGGVLITDVDEDEEEETKLHTPGEFLVVDGEGNLVACNEIDDTEEYRRLLFITDSADGGMAAGGYGGGMEGGYGDMMEGGYGDMMGSGMGMEGEEQ